MKASLTHGTTALRLAVFPWRCPCWFIAFNVFGVLAEVRTPTVLVSKKAPQGIEDWALILFFGTVGL